jgi:hypothetical protein
MQANSSVFIVSHIAFIISKHEHQSDANLEQSSQSSATAIFSFPNPSQAHKRDRPRNPHRKRSKPEYRTHLVLAVAVAAGGTTSHFDCCFVELGDKFVEGVVSRSKREGILLTGGTLGLISNQLPLTSGKALSPSFSANQRPGCP